MSPIEVNPWGHKTDLRGVELLNTYKSGEHIGVLCEYHQFFGGKKILVFKGNRFSFEPHFTKDSTLVARFRPDMWDAAVRFINLMEKNMGIVKIGSRCSAVTYTMRPFDLEKALLIDSYVTKHYIVLLVHYTDCSTFEGKKILVFEGDRFSFEPHFKKGKNLIARFRPDMWDIAVGFINQMEEEYGNC